MMDNSLNNVMDLIKRQRWEKLFKRIELIHVDAVKEFYARMTLVHHKKKDVVRSSVKGVAIEFDHLRLASVLGIPETMGYKISNLPRVMLRNMSYLISMKDHELPFGDWLTMVFEEFGVPLVDKQGRNQKDMTTLRRPFSQCVD
ncbi:hypothetical protein Dimus_022862 [Dionaea muscipula]